VPDLLQLEQLILTLSLFVEGTTEKVSQFIKPLKLIYNKNVCFREQKCIFKHCREVDLTLEISL
jgi:hypothetical protein